MRIRAARVKRKLDGFHIAVRRERGVVGERGLVSFSIGSMYNFIHLFIIMTVFIYLFFSQRDPLYYLITYRADNSKIIPLQF